MSRPPDGQERPASGQTLPEIVPLPSEPAPDGAGPPPAAGSKPDAERVTAEDVGKAVLVGVRDAGAPVAQDLYFAWAFRRKDDSTAFA